MDKNFFGGGLTIGIIVGIIFDNLALGICFGLILGGIGGKVKAARDSKPKSFSDNNPDSPD